MVNSRPKWTKSMNVTNKLLDRLSDLKGLTSDYQIAKLLRVTPQRISELRHERRHLSTTEAVQVAEQLGADPIQIIARLELERARTSRIKTVWEKYRGRLLLALVAAAGAAKIETLITTVYTLYAQRRGTLRSTHPLLALSA